MNWRLGSFSRKPGLIAQAKKQKSILSPNEIRVSHLRLGYSERGKTKQRMKKIEIIIKERKTIIVFGDFSAFFRGVLTIKQSANMKF